MPRLLSLLVLVLAVAGCDTTGDEPRDLQPVDAAAAVEVSALEGLTDARAVWEASGIEDYEVRYQRYCFCAGEVFQVRVVGGVIADVWVDGRRAHPSVASEAQTVDQLLAVAIETFERGEIASARVLLAAAPFLAEVDFENDPDLPDGFGGFRLTAFERLGE